MTDFKITETVRITVITNTKQKFTRVINVTSDGSWNSVQTEVNKHINRTFEIGEVLHSSWNYYHFYLIIA